MHWVHRVSKGEGTKGNQIDRVREEIKSCHLGSFVLDLEHLSMVSILWEINREQYETS
jgi:hypothetical protein